jgi:TonB family protein
MISTLLLLLAVQDPAQVSAPAEAPEPDAAVAAAAAPGPRLVRNPEVVIGFSEAGDAAGHTGRSTVEITIHPDGALTDAAVAETSRSDLLDAEALRMLQTFRFRPQTEAIRFQTVVEFRFSDIINMPCDEFARQVRWYVATWPERSYRDMAIYDASVGIMGMQLTGRGQVNARSLRTLVAAMDRSFVPMVEACERTPTRAYLEVMGETLR